MKRPSLPQGFSFAVALIALIAISACSEHSVLGPSLVNADPDGASGDLVTPVSCVATVASGAVTCAKPAIAGAEGASRDIIGGQNYYVKLTSSNVSYDAGTEIFQFDVTVQNLLNEAIGTPDGVTPDVNGIKVFFNGGITTTSGTGTATVANADGVQTFLNTAEPYFLYNQILSKNAVSASHTWQLNVPATVTSFAFNVYLSTLVQPLLVINEMLVNPGGTITDASGEWIEIYNAGTLRAQMQNLVIADSAAAGRRAYHLINASVIVLSGAYMTLGRTTNTTSNGGVPIDYVYTMSGFANSLGAFKVARVVGTDTLTIDRTQYASAAVSAQNGISRELTNPALDNSNMDGSNWADASVVAVYGPGGRGTPKAQNSTFIP